MAKYTQVIEVRGHIIDSLILTKIFDEIMDVKGDATYHDLVRKHFRGSLKPPFNAEARRRAGFGAQYYAPLAATE